MSKNDSYLKMNMGEGQIYYNILAYINKKLIKKCSKLSSNLVKKEDGMI